MRRAGGQISGSYLEINTDNTENAVAWTGELWNQSVVDRGRGDKMIL